MTDRDALEARIKASCDRGDHAAAADAIVRGYGPEVTSFLAAMVRGNDDQLGEAFATFCEDLWRGLPKFRFASTARTWVYTVARHAAARRRRGDRRRERRLQLPGELGDLADQVRTATVEYLRTEVKDRLALARDSLDPDDRSILILRIDRQLPWRDIALVLSDEELDAAALTRREATLRKRFEHIKRRLKERMAADPPTD